MAVVVEVLNDQTEVVVYTFTDPTVIESVEAGPQGPPGPAGPAGLDGPAGARRWYGEGPPDVVIGASPGDEYVDTLTGDLYILQ